MGLGYGHWVEPGKRTQPRATPHTVSRPWLSYSRALVLDETQTRTDTHSRYEYGSDLHVFVSYLFTLLDTFISHQISMVLLQRYIRFARVNVFAINRMQRPLRIDWYVLWCFVFATVHICIFTMMKLGGDLLTVGCTH